VLPVVKTSVKVISYKPRLQKEAWLMLPSKSISKNQLIKRDVASKSASFCADTGRQSLPINKFN
jgi:hypothetical protein